LVAILVQVPLGVLYGVQGARAYYVKDVTSARVLRNINHASNADIAQYIFLFLPPSTIRNDARTLEEHRLSVFASG
jgi:hypothetical protein